MEVINQSNIGKYINPKDKLLVITQKFKPYLLYNFLSKISGNFYKKYFEYQTNPKDLDYLRKRTWNLFFNLIKNRNCVVEWCLLGFNGSQALPQDLNRYDVFVLLYPDSLGLGFQPIENTLLKYKKPIISVNGRNRVLNFRLAKSRLCLHRVLEKYLIFECLFSLAFVLFTPFYLIFALFKPYKTKWKKARISCQEYLFRQGKARLGSMGEIEKFWEQKPMTYGDEHGQAKYQQQTVEKYNKEFFEKLDKTFYNWNKPLHSGGVFFAKLFNYEKYKGRQVLEIGCGLGTMMMNWAKNGAEVSAVDLTAEAINRTRKRFELYGLKGNFQRADARNLPYSKETFDYVYSWGVLHHSPDLRKSIQEIGRVLKRNGEMGIMLYHRGSFFHLFLTRFRQGFLHLESKFLSSLELASRYGDDYQVEGNPYTWPIKLDEINYLFDGFKALKVRILGTDLKYVFWRTCPFVFFLVPKFVRKVYAKRYGWSLWIEAKK